MHPSLRAPTTAASEEVWSGGVVPPPPLPAFLSRRSRYRRAVLGDAAAAKALLLVPPAILAADHDLSEVEVDGLLAWAAAASSPLTARPAAHRLAARFAGQSPALPLPTGVAGLDRHLLGGLLPGLVVELTGPAGSGKTRLALQWAAATAGRAGEGGRVLWLHTAPPQVFESQALHLLRQTASRSCSGGRATGRKRRRSDDDDDDDGDAETARCREERLRRNFLSLPVPVSLAECRQLHLKHAAQILADAQGGQAVRLLVLDSLSQLVHRGHSGLIDADNVQRQNSLVALVQDLKQMAARHHLCVLLLTSGGKGDAPGEFGPMLYHSVNVRLRLDEGLVTVAAAGARRKESHPLSTYTWGRVLRVVKSPVSGHVAFFLVETEDGQLTERAEAFGAEVPFALSGDLATAVDVMDYQTVPSFVCT